MKYYESDSGLHEVEAIGGKDAEKSISPSESWSEITEAEYAKKLEQLGDANVEKKAEADAVVAEQKEARVAEIVDAGLTEEQARALTGFAKGKKEPVKANTRKSK